MKDEEEEPLNPSYVKSKNEITDTAEVEKLAPKPPKTRLSAEDSCSEFG